MAGNYLLDNEGEQAARRFDALSDVFDPVTFRHLEAVGVDKGWRCWEVGAGGPSVPSWLASSVGDDCVIASDIDVRWLGTHAGFGVLEHDVVDGRSSTGPVRPRACPAGPHPSAESRRRAQQHGRRLRPGGWLVIEDFDVDFQPCATPDASTPQQYLANRIRAGFITLLAERGVDLELGRKLPRLFRQHGLGRRRRRRLLPARPPGGRGARLLQRRPGANRLDRPQGRQRRGDR